ncbi:hypothetical protein [Undibacterium curvum]|uniref:hypothetical protein n=1 Tax=Undibacterium curvum TaxID=2762294 RepID=UPI003D0F6390
MRVPDIHKKVVLSGLLCAALLAYQFPAQSQALPVPAANFVMNRAIGGVITRVAVARGFAANDPRIATTLAGTSQSLSAVNAVSTVAGVTLAVAGAPVWLTLAASLGVLAVGAAIVAGKSTIKLQNGGIIFSSNQQNVPLPYTPPSAIPAQDEFGKFAKMGLKIYKESTCLPSQMCNAYPALPAGTLPFKWPLPVINGSSQGKASVIFNDLADLTANYPARANLKPGGKLTSLGMYGDEEYTWNWQSAPTLEVSAALTYRLVGKIVEKNTCVDSDPDLAALCAPTAYTRVVDWNSQSDGIQIGKVETDTSFKTLDQAKDSLNDSMRQQPISDATLAQFADSAWKTAAATPDYKGLPYSATNPITASDVAAWRAENPNAVPVVQDLLLPANSPGVTNVVISATASNSNQSGNQTNPDPNAIYNVNVLNAPRVDLGADPQIAAPTLADTPTAASTLSPLIQLFPELKKFQVPQHLSECPKPEFDAFDKHFVIDTHCTLAEQHRTAIGSITLLMWVIVGILILLSA